MPPGDATIYVKRRPILVSESYFYVFTITNILHTIRKGVLYDITQVLPL